MSITDQPGHLPEQIVYDAEFTDDDQQAGAGGIHREPGESEEHWTARAAAYAAARARQAAARANAAPTEAGLPEEERRGAVRVGAAHAAALTRHWRTAAGVTDDQLRLELLASQYDKHQAGVSDRVAALEKERKDLKEQAKPKTKMDGSTVPAAISVTDHLKEDRKLRELVTREQAEKWEPREVDPAQIRAARTRKRHGRTGVLLASAIAVASGSVVLVLISPVAGIATLAGAAGVAALSLLGLGRRTAEQMAEALGPSAIPEELLALPLPETMRANPHATPAAPPPATAPGQPRQHQRPGTTAPGFGQQPTAPQDGPAAGPQPTGTPSAGQPTAANRPARPKSFPIVNAGDDPVTAREAVLGALVEHGIDVAELTLPVAHSWGWETTVTLASGAPDKIGTEAVRKGIITVLRLPRGGLLLESIRSDGASAVLRLLTKPAFTAADPLPYRAPLSCSILDAADFGVALDGQRLMFSLAGLMLLLVADSGGGKSGIMLGLAEYATACYDCVVIDLDPHADGISELGGGVSLKARTDQQIEAVLAFLVKVTEVRAKLRTKFGMGNRWKVSRDHPAIVVFLDEWSQLSPAAKALAVILLRMGRKEGVYLIGGSQFGTKADLGKAVGPKVRGKVLGACRGADVVDLFGAGKMAEGYRPDQLTAASETDPADAGTTYALGLPGIPDRPLPYHWREISKSDANHLGEERAAVGRPRIDTATLDATDMDWDALVALCGGSPAPSKPVSPAPLRTARRRPKPSGCSTQSGRSSVTVVTLRTC